MTVERQNRIFSEHFIPWGLILCASYVSNGPTVLAYAYYKRTGDSNSRGVDITSRRVFEPIDSILITIVKMAETRLLILYGSQTGTAQDIAERIWREGKRYGFCGPVQAMDDYPINQLIHEKLAVFVCSTTGQGEEPDNMKQFWKFLLRKNLPTNSLQGLRYAVLGLGDSSYAKFNYASKKLFRRLGNLGALSIVGVGLADDQHDLGADAVVEPWLKDLWNRLCLSTGKSPPSLDHPLEIEPRWKISISSSEAGETPSKFDDPWFSAGTLKNAVEVTVKENLRTTAPNHFQDVRLLKLSGLPGQSVYSPGDTVCVRPQNNPESVKKLLDLLAGEDGVRPGGSLKRHTLFHVEQSDPFMSVPKELQKPLTLEHLATSYWDLTAIPRRSALLVLSRVTPNELEREKLEEFCSPQGQEEMYNYLNRPRRNILELLADFPHALAHLPYSLLFELFSPIKPREFSIASSPKAHPGEVHILVAVVRYFTKLKTPRLGLCSNWLSRLQESDRIPVWFRKGSFLFPKDKDIPVIMVGPGTGVAPFRSYINERVAAGSAASELLTLFFGCRSETSDFHCKEEWQLLQRQNLLNLYCAFSRDQPDKVYVQHVIKTHKDVVWKLLSSGGFVFLAGNSKNMPQSVREAFCDVAKDCGNLTDSAAEEFMSGLEQKGMYQTETWS